MRVRREAHPRRQTESAREARGGRGAWRRRSAGPTLVAGVLALGACAAFLIGPEMRTERYASAEQVDLVRTWVAGSGALAAGLLCLGGALRWIQGGARGLALCAGIAAIAGGGAFALLHRMSPAELTWPVRAYRRVELENDMLAKYNLERYEESARLAEALLADDPEQARAWIVKGGAAFFAERYPEAVAHFSRAVALDPENPAFLRNLGYAHVEAGEFAQAIAVLERLDREVPADAFALGRAYLFAGELTRCVELLEGVPGEALRGSARVLEAACLKAQAEADSDPERRATQLARAREVLQAGVAVDRDHWRGLLSGSTRDPRMSFERPRELLAGFEGLWIEASPDTPAR